MDSVQENRVVWDGFGLSNQYSGVARHALRLSQGLNKTGISPVVFSSNKSSLTHLSHVFGRPSKFLRSPRSKLAWSRYISSQTFLKSHNHNHRLVYHGLSNFNIPLSKKLPFKRIVTIHDIIPLIAKGQVSRSSTLQLLYLLPKVLQVADRVICVSKWSRETLVEAYPDVADKVLVIPNGFVDEFLSSGVHTGYKLSDGTINALAVMRYEPYKRFDRLIDILDRMNNRFSLALVTDLQGGNWIKANGQRHLNSGRLQLGIGLSDKDLSALFRRSDFLLHTSEYEGFCLPAAQALAAIKPVIYKAGSGIDEVVGPAGLGLGDSIDEWIEAISSGLDNISEATIIQHISKQKPWSSVAIDLKQLYNKVSEE